MPELLFHDPAGPAARAALALPEDPDVAAAAIAAQVWATGATGKFAWPIPDRRLRAQLHRLSAPVLLVWGRQDRLVPAGYADEWEAELPDSRVVLIDDCGHVPQAERFAETAAAVAAFLDAR